ncbi:Zinc-binding dehydrogenase-like protein [Leptomonas seymouri]|uniref:Zinc-binding dehydrogenase-like protein n=1 Tax=Leptomonas seymouri TaxID=5684 RepID=A0A0N1I4X2_LEPSE|nr:Zinc-binding dehydrogenase-like protein [Leptomonas seymouri]|eukprot:KPI86515.1 Zinc-binding dehydrogenase-like protein [Leptomonas seymouri]
MGNSNSAAERTGVVPRAYFLLPNTPVPSLKPSHIDFSQTSGKSILCAGWVALHASPSWSKRNVVYSTDIRIPVPQPHQVRVKIYAAGVNTADTQRTTVPTQLVPAAQKKEREPTRRASRHPTAPFEFPYALGIEGAGVVESVGWDAGSDEQNGVLSDIRVGDRVAFLADMSKGSGGSFCQYALVDRDVLWKLPEVAELPSPSSSGELVPGRLIDFVEAATLPVAAVTAYIALFDKLRVEPQRTIFISGASGGVGSIAVQLAHYFGLYVVASCSTPNVQYVQSLGADYIVDYTRTDVVKEILKLTDSYGVDYLLECADASMSERHAEAVRFGGSVCVLTGLLAPLSDLVFRRQLSMHYVFLGMLHQDPIARQQLQPLGQLVLQLYAQGAFSVEIEQVPFVRAADALDARALGHGRGKVVLCNFHVNEDQEERQRRRRVHLYEKAQIQLQKDTAKATGETEEVVMEGEK